MADPPSDDAEVSVSAPFGKMLLWVSLRGDVADWAAPLQAYEPEELLDSSNIRKLIKVGTDVTAIATDAVTILQYALVRFD